MRERTPSSRPARRRRGPEYDPPKSVEQLEREQGLVGIWPDYGEIASGIWRTKEELREFELMLKSIRRPSRR